MSQSQICRLPRFPKTPRHPAHVSTVSVLSPEAERMLRDMALVCHLTRQVRAAISRETAMAESCSP